MTTGDFLVQYWQEIIAIILSGGALFVSKQAWHRSRAIYDIAKYKFPKQIGDSKTENDKRLENALRKKLRTGKWQVMHIYEKSANTLMIVIGKVRK